MKRTLKPHSQWNHPARKPCGCLYGSCLQCRSSHSARYYTEQKVAAMRMDYDSGMTQAAVERKHGVPSKGLRGIFELRKIPLRDNTLRQPRHDGCRFVADPPKTEAELSAMIASLDKVKVPAALKAEWRHWSLAKRGQFIDRVRAALVQRGRKFAPTGPCSKNVIPFGYATPAARAIADAANVGLNSRTFVIDLKPSSQGLIFEDELWFWAFDGYQRQQHGHDLKAGYRPFLHRYLYARWHGPIPDGFTVIFRDRNKNNFSKKNLALRSMADCAKHNALHAQCLRAPTPENLARKKEMFTRIADKAWETKNKKALARSRTLTANLLKTETGLLGQLQRRKYEHA